MDPTTAEIDTARREPGASDPAATAMFALIGLLLFLLVTTVAWVEARGLPAPSTPAAAEAAGAHRIAINEADAATLRLLPSIGPALAGRIVEERERAGPFRDAEDLQRVHGIGPRTAEGVAPYVRFAPPDGRR